MDQAQADYQAYKTKVDDIKNDPTYQQVLKDSFGGVMYNVANRDKYDSKELLAKWDALLPRERNACDGIMTGAINFLKDF